MRNLHYIFHKAYYEELGAAREEQVRQNNQYDRCNQILFREKFDEKTPSMPLDIAGMERFQMETVYPGLLVGIGNAHASGSQKAGEDDPQIKLGFTFDYVTGMPYIPGSTVKGCLRSAFRACPEYISELLEQVNPELKDVDVPALERELFGPWCKEKAPEQEGAISQRTRDVFFDAVIVRGGKGGRLVAPDSITPHVNRKRPELNGLTAPTPLMILKVPPMVVFEFRFLLRPHTVGNRAIRPAETKRLYQSILLDLGIGAKTNVGYGAMKKI